jgi:LysM repeat protein
LPVLVLTLALSAITLAYSAPSDESISGSGSLGTTRLRSSDDRGLSESSENSGDNSATEEAGPATSEDQGGGSSGGHSPGSSPSRPRATFPYTVRPGDTPAGIASLFGVPLADLLRVNHLHEDSELMIGDTLKVPNPFLARERQLSTELNRISTDEQAAEQRAQKSQQTISALSAQVQDLSTSNKQYEHDLRVLPWWRSTAMLAAGAAVLMLVIMLVAVVQWIIARGRFRAVAEMNESLRRLDYKYKAALAKAELRFQELYGRRRRISKEGQEPAKMPEELEIEQLNRQLKEVLEHHLQRLEPSSASAGRARWRERLAGVGAPMEARSIRR